MIKLNESNELIDKSKTFYEQTILEEPTDPNLLYDLKYKLDDYQSYC